MSVRPAALISAYPTQPTEGDDDMSRTYHHGATKRAAKDGRVRDGKPTRRAFVRRTSTRQAYVAAALEGRI